MAFILLVIMGTSIMVDSL